jgi:DNA-binding GntR family transcriptional regulator
MSIPAPNFVLDLDRNLPQTMHEQARDAIVAAIRSGRPGFCIGDKLTNQELSRQNPIHRNTLAAVMSELVRMGYLRRLPNKGFEIVQQEPERPSLLTRHILSLSEVAERDKVDCHSQLVEEETGIKRVREMTECADKICKNMGLSINDTVSVLTRCRLMKRKEATRWDMVAIEQSYFSTALVPTLLDSAIQQIKEEGDSSFYRLLRRIFPNEEFFKAHYEISLSPVPKTLEKSWMGETDKLISVVSITYCSQGAVEMTRTWFDSSKAILTAGSLDVKLVETGGEQLPRLLFSS